jgi:hypothetical protein
LRTGEWDGVDGNPADREGLVEVLLGGDVAAAGLHHHLDVERGAGGQSGDVRLGIEDVDVGVGGDVLGPDLPRLGGLEVDRLGMIDVQTKRELLEVEDEVGGVLGRAGDGRELVEHALDADRGDRGTLNARKQNATHGVPDGGAETAFEGLGEETAVGVVRDLVVHLEVTGALKAFPKHRDSVSLSR